MFTKDYFINLGLFVLPAVIIILTLHEFGHAYAAYKMGDETAKREGRLSLNPLRHIDPLGMAVFIVSIVFAGFGFGWGKAVPVDFFALRNLRKGMVVVSLAGPGINFLTALALSPLYKLMYNSSVMQAGFSYFIVLVEYIIIYSVYLGIFNLIPIPPLDGSKVLFAISKRPQRFLFDESMNWYGIIFLIILISIPFFNFGNLFLSIINPILKFLL